MASAGYIVLTFEFHQEGKRWVAVCEELGTSTFGRSLPEAEKRLKEAVVLQLNTLEDVGERERFFREYRIKFHRTRPRKQVTVSVPTYPETFVRPYVQPLRELVTA